MRDVSRFRAVVFLLMLLLGASIPEGNGVIVTFEIDSQSSINFTTNPPSFTLNFSDFRKNSVTNTVNVSYIVSANDVTRLDGVLLGRLDDLFPDISFEADFGSYVKTGGNARLVEAEPGYETVTAQNVGIANKVVDAGDGKLIEGQFDINYRARALDDLVAGSHYRVLTLTFTEA